MFRNCEESLGFVCKKPQEVTPITPNTNGCDKVSEMGEGQDEERERVGVTSGEQRGRQKREMERLVVKREMRFERCE